MEAIALKSLMSLQMRFLVLTSFQQLVMLSKVIFAHPRIHISLPLVVPVDPAQRKAARAPYSTYHIPDVIIYAWTPYSISSMLYLAALKRQLLFNPIHTRSEDVALITVAAAGSSYRRH